MQTPASTDPLVYLVGRVLEPTAEVARIQQADDVIEIERSGHDLLKMLERGLTRKQLLYSLNDDPVAAEAELESARDEGLIVVDPTGSPEMLSLVRLVGDVVDLGQVGDDVLLRRVRYADGSEGLLGLPTLIVLAQTDPRVGVNAVLATLDNESIPFEVSLPLTLLDFVALVCMGHAHIEWVEDDELWERVSQSSRSR